MEILDKIIEIINPKVLEIILRFTNNNFLYVGIGILIIQSLFIIKYHELVEGTKCYSAFLPIPLLRFYYIVKLTIGKKFAWLYVITTISTNILSLLPIKNVKFNNGLIFTAKVLLIFIILISFISIIKFIVLWIKEKTVNIKYKKLEKEDKIKKQQEEERIKQQELSQQKAQLNNTQNINNNQQTIQQTQQNNYTPMYTEELSFKPNNNTQITNTQTNNINSQNQQIINQQYNYQQQTTQQYTNQQMINQQYNYQQQPNQQPYNNNINK